MENVNVTFSIPAKLKQEMNQFSEVNWSRTAAELLEEKIKRLKILKRLDKLLDGSELTEQDVEKIAEKVKTGIAKRHGL
ncbi:MAG TPA: hypothetical protein VI912_01300 [Candidatus Bilamarchaeaceae archaeon]|nr:hypothetical protein [Candidatus Bilamarchaeaceae archaeon]